MAKKKKSEDGEAGEKGSKTPLIIGAVALVAGVVLGGKFMGGGGGAEAATTTTTTEVPGNVTSLDTITLNLADGRFLKLGVGFEVAAESTYPAHGDAGGGHAAEADESPTKGFARELDAVIDIVSTHTYEDLLAPGGKDKVKEEILHEVAEISHEAIEAVLFHEFVMQ